MFIETSQNQNHSRTVASSTAATSAGLSRTAVKSAVFTWWLNSRLVYPSQYWTNTLSESITVTLRYLGHFKNWCLLYLLTHAEVYKNWMRNRVSTTHTSWHCMHSRCSDFVQSHSRSSISAPLNLKYIVNRCDNTCHYRWQTIYDDSRQTIALYCSHGQLKDTVHRYHSNHTIRTSMAGTGSNFRTLL